MFNPISNGSGVTPGSAYQSKTDINLPKATPDATGSASVEVSISSAAQTLLTIDMSSLAAKGYTRVDIDTDGRPGAEISVEVKEGAGTVAVNVGASVSEANKQAIFNDPQVKALAAQLGIDLSDPQKQDFLLKLLDEILKENAKNQEVDNVPQSDEVVATEQQSK